MASQFCYNQSALSELSRPRKYTLLVFWLGVSTSSSPMRNVIKINISYDYLAIGVSEKLCLKKAQCFKFSSERRLRQCWNTIQGSCKQWAIMHPFHLACGGELYWCSKLQHKLHEWLVVERLSAPTPCSAGLKEKGHRVPSLPTACSSSICFPLFRQKAI